MRENTQPKIRNDFSKVVDAYSKYRRDYIDKVYDSLYSFCSEKNSMVLDLGCGTGFVTNHLAGYYKEVIGVDVSEEMMEVGKTKAPKNVSFVRASAEELPFSDSTFDLITCAAAYHWFDYQKAGKELYRVLKPSGKACVFWKYVPGSYTGLLPDFAFNNLKKFVPNPPHTNKGDIDEDIFTEAGFSKIRFEEFIFNDVYTKEEILGLTKSNSTYNLLGDTQKVEYDELNNKDVDAYLVDGRHIFKAVMEMWFLEK